MLVPNILLFLTLLCVHETSQVWRSEVTVWVLGISGWCFLPNEPSQQPSLILNDTFIFYYLYFYYLILIF